MDENSFHAFNVIPRVTLGTGNVGTQNITTIAGIGANSTLASNLLTTLAGSVGSTTANVLFAGWIESAVSALRPGAAHLGHARVGNLLPGRYQGHAIT